MTKNHYSNIDFYKFLGIEDNDTAETIKKAYRRFALANHPDKHPGDALAEDNFKIAAEAYATLSDPVLRREYDLKRQKTPPTSSSFNQASRKSAAAEKPKSKFWGMLQSWVDDRRRVAQERSELSQRIGEIQQRRAQEQLAELFRQAATIDRSPEARFFEQMKRYSAELQIKAEKRREKEMKREKKKGQGKPSFF